MKKWILLCLCSLLLVGCTSSKPQQDHQPNVDKETVSLKVLAPTGAPALAILPLFSHDQVEEITTVEGSDVLQAAFVHPSPEYDWIIAPSNLGAKLAEAGKTPYRMLAVVTWGNLYLVQSEDATAEDEVVAFGEAAVPGLIYESVRRPEQPVKYVSSVSEVQALLLTGKAKIGLMAEPAATATIAKAKEQGINLSISMDLQEAYHQNHPGSDGYPQAALFVLESQYRKHQEVYDQLIQEMQDYQAQIEQDPSKLVEDVDAIGSDTLGIAGGAIAEKTYDRMNVKIVEAHEVQPALQDFLSLFGITDSSKSLLQK